MTKILHLFSHDNHEASRHDQKFYGLEHGR